MDDKMIEIAFNIIGHSGEAKFLAKDALSKAKKGEFNEAKDLISKAHAEINEAHHSQTELITNEANGEKNELNVVLVHSQDHLMTTITYIELVEEFISLYELIMSK